MPSTPKIVCLEDITRPGDPTVGAGLTRTFQMSSPVCFTGIRLVISAYDAVTSAFSPLILRSVSHDNNQLLANANTAFLSTAAFHDDVGFDPTGAPLTFASNFPRFNEEFQVADNFSVTIFNQTLNGANVFIHWITDYGVKCRKCG